MTDNRTYFCDGLGVFIRRGNAPVVCTEVATCMSKRVARRIANCLNLYVTREEFAADVKAAEKEEVHGNAIASH